MCTVLVGCTQFCIVGKELLHISVMLHALFQIMYVDLLRYAALECGISKNLFQVIQHIIYVICISSLKEACTLLEHLLIGIGRMEISK